MIETAVSIPLVHIVDSVAVASRATFSRVIDSLAAAGAEGVVLGGTEIELLVGPEDTSVPLFPSTAPHVGSAVDAALD